MDLAVLIAIASTKKNKCFFVRFLHGGVFFPRKEFLVLFFIKMCFFYNDGKIIVNTAISLQFEIYLPCFTPHIILPVQRIVCCFKPQFVIILTQFYVINKSSNLTGLEDLLSLVGIVG